LADFDVIILGGGAAGLFCALTAGRRGRRVLVLEANERVGRKIEISGGGRCNFTNLGASPENYLSQNPDFCRSALARCTPWDFVALVEQHGIRYHEKTLGQQFCDGSSREIVTMLLAECAAARAEVRCGIRVLAVEKTDRFRVTTAQGEFTAAALVVATGGLSLPKLGATDFGYRLARQFGLRIVEPSAGLVPLTGSGWSELAGVALPVVAACDGARFREAMLFTHRGLSGPAILQISSYWRPGQPLAFDLLPDTDAATLLRTARDARRELIPTLAAHWPRRLAEAWAAREAPDKPLAHWKNADVSAHAARLHAWPFAASGTEGYATAEVTLGGVDTRELSSKTMEARAVPGLFFIGEVVDVTGWLGGYNFQWAWASAHAAGTVV
jgi:predicted Rossmann fold flavoprotein